MGRDPDLTATAAPYAKALFSSNRCSGTCPAQQPTARQGDTVLGFSQKETQPDGRPIYNSRITKSYLNYLKLNWPQIDCNELIERAGMTRYQIDDPAHWFTQEQVDRFHDLLVKKTGAVDISRQAGRHVSSSSGTGVARQYILGFVGPALAYLAAGKVVDNFSRATVNTAKRLGRNKIETTFTPLSGVREKPYQCENRLGHLEALAEAFTGKFARIDHPECFHRGDSRCRYIVTWDNSQAFFWQRIRSASLAAFVLFSLFFWEFMSLHHWLTGGFIGLSVLMALSLIAAHYEKCDLIRTIQSQKAAAQEHLEQLSARYSHAQLVQEIGQATSTAMEIDALISAVVGVISKRLDFDRGVIMLANSDKSRLEYIDGFGYSREHERLLRDNGFHLDRTTARGFFVRAFIEQKPFLMQDVQADQDHLSPRSRALAQEMGVKSLICVPIVYEKVSCGILAVDTFKSKRLLTQSDVNLLMGVASQTAISIAIAGSFSRLQVSEEKYRTILESIDDSYFEVDLCGNLTFFNESTCRMLGYGRHELVGMNYSRFMDTATAEKVFKTFKAVFQTGQANRALDWKMITKDASECFAQALVSLIRNAAGEPIGFRGLARDVTGQILAEKERKMLEARLQQAEKMKAIGTLAGGVAHDLNNVLSGIVSYPELLLMDLPADSPLRKPILTIQKSGEKASAIVQDLLTLARRGVATSQVINLNQVLDEYLKSPEHLKMRSQHPTVDITVDTEPYLLNMIGSPVHISKSLMNIVNNAAEAMPSGGQIRIKTENRYADRAVKGFDTIAAGEYVILSISDDGIGIPAADIERIFEPFYTKKVMGRSGSGLGMAVVWGTVKDHGGSIDVKSRPQRGTTFTLFFPVTRKALERKNEPFAREKYMGRQESILIVDDVVEQREIASELLKKLGYTVAAVASGEAAVAHLKKERVDLVILDMIMDPGMNGLDTYRNILTLNPRQKAVIASGFSETDLVREVQRLGAGVYVKKPYTTEEIGVAVYQVLNAANEPVPKTFPLAG
ncbi:MAG: ATP-binding protein [Desulfobacterales bacterium]